MNNQSFGWRASALLVVVVFSLASGCSRREDSLARGDGFFEKKDYRAALVEYRNAVAKDERSVPARKKLAQTFLALGSNDGARREFVRAADLAPNDDDLQMDAAEALMRTGEFLDARTRAERVIARNPRNVRAHMIRGLATAGMNDLDTAVEDVQKALELDPRLASTYANLGAIQLARGHGDEAEAALKQAAALAPEDVDPYLALANYYWRGGRRAEAEQALKSALSRKPNHLVANRALAMFYVVNGRAAEAEAPLKAAAAADDALEARLALADFYVGQRRPAEATPILEELAKRREARAAARSRLAGIEYTGGARDRAYTLIEEVLKEQPKNVQVLVLKGRWQLSEGQLDKALATASAAVAAEPKSVTAHYLLGNVHAARRELSAAADDYNAVLELNPRVVPAQLELARVNLQRGQPDTAVLFASQALKNDPRNLDARLALVKGLRVRGDLRRARTEIAPLIEAAPRSPSVNLESGELALAEKRYGDAEKAFTATLEADADSIDAVAGLVNVDVAEHKLDSAKKRVDSQLARHPKDAQMMMVAGRTYAIAGDVETAETLLQKAIATDPNYMPAYHILGQVLVRQKRLGEATARYEAMAARQPDAVPIQTMVAMLLQVQNKSDEARKRYEQILQIDSRAVVANNNLAYMKAEAGTELDVALQLAQTAKAVKPDDPDVNDTLGWVYYKRNMATLAVGPLKFSVDKVPGNPLYRYHLGMTYLKTGDKKMAREMLTEAIRLAPRFDGANEARRALEGLGR